VAGPAGRQLLLILGGAADRMTCGTPLDLTTCSAADFDEA